MYFYNFYCENAILNALFQSKQQLQRLFECSPFVQLRRSHRNQHLQLTANWRIFIVSSSDRNSNLRRRQEGKMQKDAYKSLTLEEKGCRNSCRVVLVVCWWIATSYFEPNMSWAAAFESTKKKLIAFSVHTWLISSFSIAVCSLVVLWIQVFWNPKPLYLIKKAM